MLKNQVSTISKNILVFHAYITSKSASRKHLLSNNDVKKMLSFYPVIKKSQCPTSVQEIFFNALFSLLMINNSSRLQNRVSKIIPFLLKSLMPCGKITRAHCTIWKIIHALVFQNKSNMIIFRQSKGFSLIKKFLALGKINNPKQHLELVKCLKSIKRQLSKINECISPAAIKEARTKLKKEENLLRNKINLQSIALNNQKATALEKNVLSIFHKTFLCKLPKIFWTK